MPDPSKQGTKAPFEIQSVLCERQKRLGTIGLHASCCVPSGVRNPFFRRPDRGGTRWGWGRWPTPDALYLPLFREMFVLAMDRPQ